MSSLAVVSGSLVSLPALTDGSLSTRLGPSFYNSRVTTTRLPPPRASGADSIPDSTVRVKLMLAENSGKLDLSECGLEKVPSAVFEIEGLEELSLAGNLLTSLPADIGKLTSLQKLQLSGNLLQELPPELGALRDLEGLWLHSNQLTALPSTLGELTQLTQLALASNALSQLPDSVSNLTALKDLTLTGNKLASLPEHIGDLAALVKLSLHGNQLAHVPPSIAGMTSLKELWMQGNPHLTTLPAELAQLPSLEHFSAADCTLHAAGELFAALSRAPSLKTLSVYGNNLESLPPELLEAPNLVSLWAEGNPLSVSAASALIRGLAAAGDHFKVLGLDTSQVTEVTHGVLDAAGNRLKVSTICGAGPGYFKLEQAGSVRAQVLVVAFGSAPGVPNWGGLMSRIRRESEDPSHTAFDVLYIVDPHRAWYGGGDAVEFERYSERLRHVTKEYSNVVMLGDSMGATAALLFAGQATAVHAFCPQVELASCSIRPARDSAWWGSLQDRTIAGLEACRGKVVVHVGNWNHDLHQVNQLPRDAPNLQVKIYSVDSHRLALALDRTGKLLKTVKAAILNEMGITSNDNVRIANLF